MTHTFLMRDDLILSAKVAWVTALGMLFHLVICSGVFRLCTGVELKLISDCGLIGLSLAMVVLMIATFVRPSKVRKFIVLIREELLFGIAVTAASIYITCGVMLWALWVMENALGLDADRDFPGHNRLYAPYLLFGVAMWLTWLIGRSVAEPARNEPINDLEQPLFDRK